MQRGTIKTISNGGKSPHKLHQRHFIIIIINFDLCVFGIFGIHRIREHTHIYELPGNKFH